MKQIMIQQSRTKLVKNIPVISTICSSLIMGLITISQAGGPPPGTTQPPTQPATGKPAEAEPETTQPTPPQPPAESGKPAEVEPETTQPTPPQPPAESGKPAEVEPETTQPTRRQPPAESGKPAEVEPETTQPTPRQPPAESGKPAEVEPETTQPTPPQPPTTEQPETTTQPPPRFPEPAGRVTPVDGLVTLRLINQTDAVITYQVIGGRYRTLGERSVVEITDFSTPLTLTYERPDGGLLLVRPRNISSGVLEVQFNATEDFDLDTNSLNITERGTVFLN